MVYSVNITEQADKDIKGNRDLRAAKKIVKCLGLLEQNPHHPSLNSHPFETFDAIFGEKIWESYVENKTPGAWRVWWFFGPERGQITVVKVARHP